MSNVTFYYRPGRTPFYCGAVMQVQEGGGVDLDGRGGGPQQGPPAVGRAQVGRTALHQVRARLLRGQ